MKKLIKVFLLFLLFTTALKANTDSCPCNKEDYKECALGATSPTGYQINIPIEYKEGSKNYTLCGAGFCMPSYIIERETSLKGTVYDGTEFNLILCNGEKKLSIQEVQRTTKKCTVSNRIECN